MLNLITYRKDQFAHLRSRLESEGYEYTSALSLSNTAQIALQAGEGDMALDVSSLLSLLDPSGGKGSMAATFEGLLYQMPESTVFIADETTADRYAYEMRTFLCNKKSRSTSGFAYFGKKKGDRPLWTVAFVNCCVVCLRRGS